MKEETPEKPSTEGLDLATMLAIERTELALERTHLAWIRTTVTLITSGFAIDTVAEVYHQNMVAAGKAFIKQAHFLSLIMVITAIVLLLSESVNYISRSRQLEKIKKTEKKNLPHGTVLAGFIFLIGLLLIYYLLFAK